MDDWSLGLGHEPAAKSGMHLARSMSEKEEKEEKEEEAVMMAPPIFTMLAGCSMQIVAAPEEQTTMMAPPVFTMLAGCSMQIVSAPQEGIAPPVFKGLAGCEMRIVSSSATSEQRSASEARELAMQSSIASQMEEWRQAEDESAAAVAERPWMAGVLRLAAPLSTSAREMAVQAELAKIDQIASCMAELKDDAFTL